jgi:outer membrane protein assembly factor BamB
MPIFPLQNFDTLADGDYAGWAVGAFSGDADDWRGVRTCTAHSGAKIFRFGGTTCIAGYGPSTHSIAIPWGGIPVPAGATNIRLSFWHRWSFETSYDGGYLRIALPGTSYYYVPGTAILSNSYSTGMNVYLGAPVWHGTQSTFVNTVVDLDAACRVIDASGCAGKTVYLGFTTFADSMDEGGPYAGWFIDDVVFTTDVPGSCGAGPQPVQAFTARSTSGMNLLEWQNPAAGAYGSAVVRYRTDGTFPLSAFDGSAVTCSGQSTSVGAYNSCSHSGTNGITYSYSLFVNNGSGVYSSPRTVAATPFDSTTGPRKWAYSTGAANLAPAGILPGAVGTGGVFVVSNDRALHAVNPTAAADGGSWPRTAPFAWVPYAMNGPAQHRPPVVPLSAGPRVFLASQDGYAYAVNARTGAVVWTSTKLGDVLQANPAGLFADLVPGAPDRVFVGTRNATSANTLYALNPATGAVVSQFDNGGGASAIGIITGIAVDYAKNYVYFTSRASGTGSSHTLWCLDATGGTLGKVWSLPVGDIDGSPVLYQGRLYVGTNAGEVKAIDPAGPTVAWTYTCSPADGAVKGYVFPHLGSSPKRLYFATTNRVWAIQDDGGSASGLWSVPVTNPSIPLYVNGTNHLLVGSSNGTLYELSTVDGSQEGSVGLGSSALGSPARDSINDLYHVGSTAGVLHAVTLPVP